MNLIEEPPRYDPPKLMVSRRQYDWLKEKGFIDENGKWTSVRERTLPSELDEGKRIPS